MVISLPSLSANIHTAPFFIENMARGLKVQWHPSIIEEEATRICEDRIATFIE